MKALSRVLFFAAVMMAVGVQASDQDIDIQYTSRFLTPIDLPERETATFWKRFKFAYDQRADQIFADRLDPFDDMRWRIEGSDRNSSYYRERINSAAQNALSTSVSYSLREAALDLPIMSWIMERQSFFAEFLFDTLGSVEEEAVSPLDLSYQSVERSWWQQLSQSHQVRYGIRPLRTDPYAFLSGSIRDGEKALLLGHVRYHFRNFTDHRFELAVSVPVAPDLSVDVGTFYQFGQHDDVRKLVVKIFKEFKSGSIMHIGLEAGERPAMFAALAVPW